MKEKNLLRKESEQNISTEKYIKIFGSLAFVIDLIVSMQVSTQMLAYKTGYTTQLGYEISEHFYWFFSIYFWYNEYGAVQPELFAEPIKTGIFVFALLFLVIATVIGLVRSKLKAIETLHGSARWATEKELYSMALLHKTDKNDNKPYVYVGAYKDSHGKIKYLKHSGAEHILCYAPTRSGKGVGLVIPSLLTWNESALITDLKGELWAITAGYRKSIGQKVIRFEPASFDSAKWNPLEEIRIGTPYEVGDAQNLATMIVDPDGKGLEGEGSHWKKTAFALYTGLILHVLYQKKNGDIEEASMRAIDNIFNDPKLDLGELWKSMAEYPHYWNGEYEDVVDKNGQPVMDGGVGGKPKQRKKGKVHPVVLAAAKDQMDRPKEEGGSVLSTVKSNLSLFRDPIVTENTSHSDFKIKDLMNCNDPVSCYVVTQPVDKTRLKPLIRIFINMTVRLLADKMKFEKGRGLSCNHHRLLMMLDEFPSLGKLEVMQESLAFVAGYGIKCYLITQDLEQLRDQYGQHESITSNCHIQNAYPPNKMDTAKYLSEMTGTTTVVKKSVTKSGKGVNISTSTTLQEVQRPLLTPDECMRLKGATKVGNDIKEAGDMLIFSAGYPAIYGKQILYFKDPIFLKRSLIEAPDKTDIIETKDRYIDPEEKKQEVQRQLKEKIDIKVSLEELKEENK